MCKKCFAFDIKNKIKSFILWLIYIDQVKKKVFGRKLILKFFFLHFPLKITKTHYKIQILSQIFRNINIPKSIKLNANASYN